jgi:hypothetical protein
MDEKNNSKDHNRWHFVYIEEEPLKAHQTVSFVKFPLSLRSAPFLGFTWRFSYDNVGFDGY